MEEGREVGQRQDGGTMLERMTTNGGTRMPFTGGRGTQKVGIYLFALKRIGNL